MPTQAGNAWLSIVPVAREPQLVQRAAGVPVYRHFGVSGRERHPSLRLRRVAPRAAVGLRLPLTQAPRRNIRRRASPSRSAACSAPSHSSCASASTCRRRANVRPARFDLRLQRPDLGRALRAARRLRRARFADGSTACSSSPSASISASCSAPWSRFSSCSRHGHDRRPLFQLLQMTLVIAVAPLLTGLVAQDQGAPAAPTRAAAHPALSRSRCASRARRRSSPTPRPGCSASCPISCSPRPGSPPRWSRPSRPGSCSAGRPISSPSSRCLGAARFFLALAGLDVGTSFGGLGSSREALFATLAEPAMIMIVFTLALVAGSTQLSTVAAYHDLELCRPARHARHGAGRAHHRRASPRTAVFRSTIPRPISN